MLLGKTRRKADQRSGDWTEEKNKKLVRKTLFFFVPICNALLNQNFLLDVVSSIVREPFPFTPRD